MGNCLSCLRGEGHSTNCSVLQQFPDDVSDDGQCSDQSTVEMDKSSGDNGQDLHDSAKDQYTQELEKQLDCLHEELKMEKQKLLCIQKERDEEQEKLADKQQHVEELERYILYITEELTREKQMLLSLQEERDDQQKTLVAKAQRVEELERNVKSENKEVKMERQKLLSVQEEKEMLSAKVEDLEKYVDSVRNELEEEKLVKERELQNMTTKREKEVAEHKKQLASVMQELEAEKQKSFQSSLEKEQSAKDDIQNPETLSLRHFSSVDPVLRKNHKAYFKGFFLLRTPLLINEEPAQAGPNEQGWLTLRCPTTHAAITFNDLYTEVSAAVERCSSLHISNFWYDDVPVFQLHISSADHLKKLLRSKNQLQKQLTTKLSKTKAQVQLQSDIFLVLPSASDSGGQIVHVTLDNAEECMARWERTAAFTFQAIFQQWDEYSRRTEPKLGPDNVGDLADELDHVAAEWYLLARKLEVPYSELQIIRHDCGQDARRCMERMLKWWLDHDLEAKWSTIVLALAKIGKKNLAHEIALNHEIPTKWIADVCTARGAAEEHLMEHPSAVQKELMKSVDELRSSIKSKDLELTKQQEVLKEAQQDGDAIQQRLIHAKESMSSHHSTIEELEEEKMELEKALKLREREIEILKDCARKERDLIILREEEVADYKKKLESVKKKLEGERQKIPPLKEKIQQLREELAKKSEENNHLRITWEEAKSKLLMEKKRLEMKTKELTAAAVSRDEHMKEVQAQLASLEESKKQKMEIVHNLQESLKAKEAEIVALSQQIAAKEGQGNGQTYTEDAAELQMKEKTADMKTNLIRLQNEVDRLKRAAKLSQEEAICYQEHATSILTATRVKLALEWSDRKRAPEPLRRGAAAVHGTIVYIIGHDSRTIYRYRFNQNRWNKHSKCPHVNPGLVIVNDLLTAVGGDEVDRPTNKLVSFNRTKWVETFPPMQTPRVSPAVVHYGNYVIAMGGDREKRGVELLHIPSLRWSTATSLPSSLSRITATLCHDSIITMDNLGHAYTINIETLLSSIRLEESSTEHSRWISLPQCPVGWGHTLSTICGQCLVVSRDGIFQLQEGQWVRIGDMSVPRDYCIVCVMCDQMVVVGGSHPGRTGYLTGYHPPTDAVCVAIIV